MKSGAEELLNLLLWSADRLIQPTFRNLTDSYESWVYRNNLSRQLKALTDRGLVELDRVCSSDRLYRLTAAGRLHALGGRDPEARWRRRWDRQWRLVMFDVPMERHSHRLWLRRYLRARGFGCLQKSVWVTPDPSHREREILAAGTIDVGSLLLWEGRPCSGETDAQIVARAWNFDAINIRYARHLRLLGQRPTGSLRHAGTAAAFKHWAAAERAAWCAAVDIDPLLPKVLLPANYLGRQAWHCRVIVLRQAQGQLRSFSG